MKIQEVLPDCPEMSDDMRLDMHRKYDKQYLFYRKHKTYIDCFCTNCLKRYRFNLDQELITPLDYIDLNIAHSIAHNAEIFCPKCDKKVIAKSEGISRKNLFEVNNIVAFFVKKNKIFAVCGQLVSEYCDGKNIDWLSQNYRGAAFYIVYAVEYTPGNSQLFYDFLGCYKQSELMYEPYIYSGLYGREYFTAYNPEVLSKSFLKYALPRMYVGAHSEQRERLYDGFKPLLYMMYAARYPAIEMLIKSDGKEIVREIVDHSRNHKSIINLEGKNASEVFRTDSNDAAVIRQTMAGDKYIIDVNALQCWRRLKSIGKRQGRKYKFKDAIAFDKEVGRSISVALNCIGKTNLTPQKYINYLKKESSKQGKFDWRTLIQTYEDYIRECRLIGYNTADDQISRPPDLQAAHERTSTAARAIEQERLEKEAAEQTRIYMDERYQKLVKMYEYADKRYCIIVPKSAIEIVYEGKDLHHCVAGYAERHINGVLTILFMRDVNHKGSALYTIEMRGKELRQIRGMKNCDPTPQAQKFVDKWLKWIALPEKQKHPKNKKAKKAS